MNDVRSARHAWRRVAVAVACSLAGATAAQAQDVGYTASLYLSRVTFPDETDRATSIYLFNSVDLATGPVRVSISVPLVHRRSTFTDATVDATSGSTGEFTETTTGVADPLIRVDLRVLDDRTRGLQLGVAASVKPPLARADGGLGTGEMDVGIGGSMFTGRGNTSLFADLLFWKYGDPEGVDFQDSLSYSVGFGRIIGGSRWSAMAALGGFSRGIDGEAGPLQLNITMLALASRRQSVAVTTGIGLNDAARGFSIGTSWRISR
jgi:hypothetical protein